MMQLLSTITSEDLQYAKSNIALYSGNYNVPPTVFYGFTGGDISDVFVYYSKGKPTTIKSAGKNAIELIYYKF